jgi:hypothetical protein
MAMTIAPQQTTQGNMRAYVDRVARLIDDWTLLTTGRPAAPLFHQFASNLEQCVPPDAWRHHSVLCADGTPIELCETIAPVVVGPAYTCDLGPYGADPATRLALAMRAAARLHANAAEAEHLLAALREVLFPPQVPLEPHTLWIGAAHGQNGAARIKLYWNLHWKTTDDAWDRALAALATVGCRLDPAAQRLCQRLATWGFPRIMALSVQPDGHVTAKLYYRLAQVNLDRLAQLAHGCDLPSTRFGDYVRQVLHRDGTWCDDRAGVALALDRDGAVEGLALYHYTWPYFANDAALRQRMLAAAPAFGWDVGGYRAASRLVDGPARCRHLLGFGLGRTGVPGLHVYASTGHLWQ